MVFCYSGNILFQGGGDSLLSNPSCRKESMTLTGHLWGSYSSMKSIQRPHIKVPEVWEQVPNPPGRGCREELWEPGLGGPLRRNHQDLLLVLPNLAVSLWAGSLGEALTCIPKSDGPLVSAGQASRHHARGTRVTTDMPAVVQHALEGTASRCGGRECRGTLTWRHGSLTVPTRREWLETCEKTLRPRTADRIASLTVNPHPL